jgi:hypothetical protein
MPTRSLVETARPEENAMIHRLVPARLRAMPAKRSNAGRVALLVAALAAATAVTTPAAYANPARTLLPPTQTMGEVRQIHLRRVEKGLRDTLAFSGKIAVLSEPTPVEEKKSKTKAQPLASDPRIQKADLARQEGTDLAMEGKHRQALPKLKKAIALYEAAYAELVDYSKLADAYARAGVSAWAGGKGARASAGFFDDGLRLQPTLAIDRRAADKGLLALFDARRAAAEAGAKASVVITGDAEGAIAFVDGVRVGPLPATASGLGRGTHFVQVRGDGWHTFAKRVRVGGKDVTVKARLKAIKAADPGAPAAVLSFDDLAPCVAKGDFSDKACRRVVAKICRQAAADYVLYSWLVADRYGRLALHAFLQRADGKVVVVPARDLDKNLSDVAAQITELSKEVGELVADFPVDRALNKRSKLFR